jgi:hypothetical protein
MPDIIFIVLTEKTVGVSVGVETQLDIFDKVTEIY